MELVTLKMFYTSVEAKMYQTRLKTYGIESFIFGDVSGTIEPMFSANSNGIKLSVKKEDIQKVKDILDELEK